MLKHTHHIIPKHMGGSDDPSNLIELTVEEHAEAHRILYEKYGAEQDKLAWQGLLGMIGKEEIIHSLQKIGGLKASTIINQRIENGELKGNRFDSKTGKEMSIKGNEAKKIDMHVNPEKYEKIYEKISLFQKENNSMKGKCWCVPLDVTDPAKERKVYPIDNIPDGWIRQTDYTDSKKRKNGCYNMMWIKKIDSKENKYVPKNSIIPDGWVRGRYNK